MTAPTDGTEHGDDVGPDTGADVGHELDAERTTAPMSEVTGRAAAAGFLVLALGSAIAFGVPALAL